MAKIIFSILVLGGLGFLIFSSNKKDENLSPSTNESVAESQEKEETKDFSEKTSLARLMEKGGDYQCTFTHETQAGDSSGTVYISGKKIRGDFVSKVSIAGLPDIGDVKTFMISDGESVYTWSSMTSDGYKAPINKDVTSQDSSGVPTNQELDYKCIGWKVDQSKFSLPTNITFKTI
ncbi:MAG: hypothetical protein QG654_469 [Patescibacteria group bacterium]|nr:hypothetical protein [Patescibacteria group bacterium]